MKAKCKRLLSLLLVFVLVFGLMPSVYAATDDGTAPTTEPAATVETEPEETEPSAATDPAETTSATDPTETTAAPTDATEDESEDDEMTLEEWDELRFAALSCELPSPYEEYFPFDPSIKYPYGEPVENYYPSSLMGDRDNPYIDDGDSAHMLDIFCPQTAVKPLPVIVNIHGGGLIMANMPAKAFNEYTMGSWGRFLASIAEEAREKVAMNSAIRQQWSEEYRKHLVAMFNKEEILYLADRLDDVSDVMSKSRMPSQEATVLTAAKDQLKYMLSSDVQLINVFVDALKQQGQVATDFSQAWAQLLKSRRQIHEVRDNNITTFYEKKVRNFFDRHGAEVGNGFVEIHETPELVRFLQGALEDIIDSDDIFSAAFEDELETRLNEDSMPTDAKQYIRNKLTGSEVYTYLQTNFALGEPVVSSILLKIGTKLYKNLHGSLAPETYYYNTGNSNAAEALVLFEVSRENLVSGEVV